MYEFTTKWTEEDPVEQIDFYVRDFFNDLAEFIIEAKTTGNKLTYTIIDLAYAKRMFDIAERTSLWGNTFSSGIEAKICQKLFKLSIGIDPGKAMKYADYVQSIMTELELHHEDYQA